MRYKYPHSGTDKIVWQERFTSTSYVVANGGVTTGALTFNSGATFDGTAKYVDYMPKDHGMPGRWSLFVDFILNDITGVYTLLSRDSATASYRQFHVSIVAGGLQVMIEWADGTYSNLFDMVNSVNAGRRQQIGITYDGATLRTYVCGVAGSTLAVAGKRFRRSIAPFRVGARARAGYECYWKGSIKEMRIYGTPLGESDFQGFWLDAQGSSGANLDIPPVLDGLVMWLDPRVGGVSNTQPVLVDGGFDNGTGWTPAASWTIADGVASHDNSVSAAALNATISLVVGNHYIRGCDIVSTNGGGAFLGINNGLNWFNTTNVAPVISETTATTVGGVYVYTAAAAYTWVGSIDNVWFRNVSQTSITPSSLGTITAPLVQATAASMPWITSQNNNQYLRFNVDNLTSTAPASDFKFLHDGSGATIYAVTRPVTLTATNKIITTNSSSAAGSGLALGVESSSNRARLQLSNSTGSYTTDITAAGSAVVSTTSILCAQVEDSNVSLRYNGIDMVSAVPTNLSEANPATSLVLGNSTASADDCNGDILLYNRVLTEAEKRLVDNWLGTRYSTAILHDPVGFTFLTTDTSQSHVVRVTTGGTYTFNWGDGTTTAGVGNGANQTITKNYTSAGVYKVSFVIDDPMKLLHYNFDANAVVGQLPPLNTYTSFSTLECVANKLIGSIPNLDNNTAISGIQCNNNTLTGSIPSFSNNPLLSQVRIFTNLLTGNIPNLDNNPLMLSFLVYDNQLSGNIPSLTNNTIIVNFWAYTNQLTGYTPSVIAPSCSNFSVQNNLLPASAINQILSDFVTNLAARPHAGTLNLGGTGNMAPTGQGLIDKQALIDWGWTVTTNVKPVITAAVLGGTALALTGTTFTSLFVNVDITGAGAVTLTQSEITGGGGSVSATSIVIPLALIPGVDGTSIVTVTTTTGETSDGVLVDVWETTIAASIGSDGNVTITGEYLDVPLVNVIVAGSGAGTLTRAAIIAAGGSASNSAVVVPASLLGNTDSTSTIKVTTSAGVSSIIGGWWNPAVPVGAFGGWWSDEDWEGSVTYAAQPVIADADMEAVGVESWSVLTPANAIASKESGAYAGSQCMRLTATAETANQAKQNCHISGNRYQVTVAIRGSVDTLRVYDGSGAVWQGFYADWDQVNIEYTAGNVALGVGYRYGTGYVEFDDLASTNKSITTVTPRARAGAFANHTEVQATAANMPYEGLVNGKKALTFDGSTDRIGGSLALASYAALHASVGYSIVVAFYLDATSAGWSTLFDTSSWGATGVLLSTNNTNQNIEAGVYRNANPSTVIKTTPNGSCLKGAWHIVELGWDEATGISIKIDGGTTHTQANVGPLPVGNSSTVPFVGATSSGGYQVKGLIAHRTILLGKRTAAATEIARHIAIDLFGTTTLTNTSITESGNLTLTGTAFDTLSSVTITGAGATTITRSALVTAGGTVSSTSIVVPASLLANTDSTSAVTVTTAGGTSNSLGSWWTPAIQVGAFGGWWVDPDYEGSLTYAAQPVITSFEMDDSTGWTLGGGWSMADGKLIRVSGVGSYAESPLKTLVTACRYRDEIASSGVVGSVARYLGSVPQQLTNGIATYEGTTSGAQYNFYGTGDAHIDYTRNIRNISITTVTPRARAGVFANHTEVQATAAAMPWKNSNGIQAALNDNLMSSLAASAFKFTHDGTGVTVFSVIVPSATTVSNPEVLIATRVNTFSDTGFMIQSLPNGAFRVFVGNGSGVAHISATAANGIFVANTPAALIMRWVSPGNLEIWVNNVRVINAAQVGSPSAGDPSATYTLFQNQSTAAIRTHGALPARVTDTQLATLGSYLAANYGGTWV